MSIKTKIYIMRMVIVLNILALAHMIISPFIGPPYFPENIESNRDVIAMIMIAPTFLMGLIFVSLLFVWRKDIDFIFPDKSKKK